MASRDQTEKEIASKFPPDSKKGRGKDLTVMLTGDVAKLLGHSDYTKVKLSELSESDLDKLHARVTKRSSTLRAQVIRLAHEVPALRRHLVPLLQGKLAMEHASPEAFQAYKKLHPDLDESKHTVKKPSKDEGGKKDEGEDKEKPIKELEKEADEAAEAQSKQFSIVRETITEVDRVDAKIRDILYDSTDKKAKQALDDITEYLKMVSNTSTSAKKLRDQWPSKGISGLQGAKDSSVREYAGEFKDRLQDALDERGRMEEAEAKTKASNAAFNKAELREYEKKKRKD